MTTKAQAKSAATAARKAAPIPQAPKTTDAANAESAVPARKTKASVAVDAALDPKPVDAPRPARTKKTVVEDLAASAAPAKAARSARPSADKSTRAKKEKVVRDSFTMPKSDYARIATLKQKCLANGVHIKKSELLRAGLVMLENATVKNLLGVVGGLEAVKTGRPVKG
jgi:hypothetical protein